MNRITTALSAAIPAGPVVSGSGSGPLGTSGSEGGGGIGNGGLSPFEAAPGAPTIHEGSSQPQIYDDPRSTHFGSSTGSEREKDRMLGWYHRGGAEEAHQSKVVLGLKGSDPSRPGILRHASETAVAGRGKSPSSFPRDGGIKLSGSSPRGRYKDHTVRANLSTAAKRTRLNGMVKAPHGEKYAVGGGSYLRILEIHNPKSGSATPTTDKDTRNARHSAHLARGTGGVVVEEVINLWKGHWSVGKGVNDLDWGMGSFEQKLVTATPSGNFMLFDVNRGKLDRDVFSGAARPLNCVRMCKVDGHGHLLLTGGTEGQARIWDLRDRDPTSRKQFKHSVPITSLAFAPEEQHSFVVGLDNGTIKRYDLRQASRSVGSVWGAHGTKPVLDLQWKSAQAAEGGWLASAGGDRCVQIWDMSQSWEKNSSPIHTLHTAHALRRIAWRPSHETELITIPFNASLANADPASTATFAEPLDEDAHLEIWDVRRHFIAKYNLATSDGAPVGIAFGENPDTLVTCFQNGVFAQLDVRNAGYPLENISRQVTSWSCRGEMVYALDRFKVGEIPFDDLKAEYVNHWDKLGRNPKGIADAPYEPIQATGVVPVGDENEDVFRYLALHYRLEGDTPENLCLWNREIAGECDLAEDARLWSFLKSLIDEFAPSGQRQFNEQIFSSSLGQPARIPSPLNLSPGNSPLPTPDVRPISLSPEAIRGSGIPLDPSDEATFDDSQDAIEELLDPTPSGSTSGSMTPLRSRFRVFKPPDTRNYSDARTSISTITPRNTIRPLAPVEPPKKRSSSSSSSSSEHKAPNPNMTASRVLYDWPDPYGIAPSSDHSGSNSRNSPALPPVKLESRTASPRLPEISPTAKTFTRRTSSGPGRTRVLSLEKNERSTSSNPVTAPKIFGNQDEQSREAYKERRIRPFLDWWNSYVEDGQVQLAISIYIVSRQILPFPKSQCERIADAYIDMLHSHRLDTVAAYVRKYARFPSLETYLSQDGITQVEHCQRCHRPTGSLEDIGDLTKRFWWCKRCKMAAKQCAVCREGVRGIWMECGRCHHGGHQSCMRIYYTNAELKVGPEKAPGRGSTSSGLQRVTTRATDSHDSLNHLDKSRSSGETTRNEVEEGVTKEIRWNACPTGCGCKCRTVIGARHKEVEPD